MIHKVYSGLSIKQRNKTQSGFVYIIEAHNIFFKGKNKLED